MSISFNNYIDCDDYVNNNEPLHPSEKALVESIAKIKKLTFNLDDASACRKILDEHDSIPFSILKQNTNDAGRGFMSMYEDSDSEFVQCTASKRKRPD
jgi:hypothetical protein